MLSMRCVHMMDVFLLGMQMDELIVELNQASNYDVIEQYSEYIGKQLNSLQKQKYTRFL